MCQNAFFPCLQEIRKGSSASSIKRKNSVTKQDPLKIVHSCKVANYKDIQKKSIPFIYSKLAEY